MARWFSHVPKPELTAAAASIAVSVLLLAIKFVAFFLTGSTAIFSDALESIVNVLAAGFAGYSLLLAHQPADQQHPYGHGKIEFMSAGFEGGMILLAAILIVVRAIEALIVGLEIAKLEWGLMLIVGAGFVNGIVGLYLIRAGRKHGSVTLVADGKHLLSDAITSVMVIAGLIVVKLTGIPRLDPVAALVVAAYLIYLAADLLSESAAGLMDKQDVRDEAMLQRILDSHLAPSGKPPLICSYHKVRHRHSGRYHWVDFHIMVPAGWDVQHGHEVASAIEYEIEQAIGEGNATAHVEPCVTEHCAGCGREPQMNADERR